MKWGASWSWLSFHASQGVEPVEFPRKMNDLEQALRKISPMWSKIPTKLISARDEGKTNSSGLGDSFFLCSESDWEGPSSHSCSSGLVLYF